MKRIVLQNLEFCKVEEIRGFLINVLRLKLGIESVVFIVNCQFVFVCKIDKCFQLDEIEEAEEISQV